MKTYKFAAGLSSIHLLTLYGVLTMAIAASTPLEAAEKPGDSTTQAESEAAADMHLVNGKLKNLEELLNLNGITFEYPEEKSETPMMIVEMAGHYSLLMLEPEDSTHPMISFLVSMPDKKLTQAQANEWNSTRMYGRVYLDEDQDPFIEMNLLLTRGGISEGLFEDYLGLWEDIIIDFESFGSTKPNDRMKNAAELLQK